ncbi:MAG: alpha/beta hydrolase [Chloroflexota bacterium]|nr:alpha/beta hydrolase [Chloroflexota bacterium]
MVDEQTVEINGISVNYARIGSGPALVLVHAGGTQSSWHTWRDNLASLSQHYTVLIPDLPGLGESGPPPAPIDSEDDFFRYYPRFIESFVRATAPDGAVMIGAASGGGICLTAAARYPDIVRALVLVDAEVIGRVIETETALLRCPTLIVWQLDDMLVPPDHATTLARRIPGAELRLFPGDSTRDEWGGNMPHRLWPSEFDATVLDFLNRVTLQRRSA